MIGIDKRSTVVRAGRKCRNFLKILQTLSANENAQVSPYFSGKLALAYA